MCLPHIVCCNGNGDGRVNLSVIYHLPTVVGNFQRAALASQGILVPNEISVLLQDV